MTEEHQGAEMMLRAAEQGNLEEVQRLLNTGVPASAADENGRTALHFASYEGHLDIVKLLIDVGVDVNAQTQVKNAYYHDPLMARDSVAPLHLAAAQGHAAIVEALLNAGADISARCESYLHCTNALHLAATYNYPDIVQLLIDRGALTADLDEAQLRLRSAILDGDINALDVMMQQEGFDINERCFYLYNGHLHLDYQQSHGNRFKLVLWDVTPLYLAIQSGHSDVLDMILNHPGIDVEGTAPEDRFESEVSPLHLAVRLGDKAAVRKLLDADADIERTSECWRDDLSYYISPLTLAVASYNLEMTRFLLEKGADINGRSSYRSVPLSYAAMIGVDLVDFLLKQGADPNGDTPFYYRTTLYRALCDGSAESVDALLRGGAIPLQGRDGDFSYTLEFAVLEETKWISEKLLLLINAGFDSFYYDGDDSNLYIDEDWAGALQGNFVLSSGSHTVIQAIMDASAGMGRSFLNDFKIQFECSLLESVLSRPSSARQGLGEGVPIDYFKSVMVLLDAGDTYDDATEEEKALVAAVQGLRDEKYEASVPVLFSVLHEDLKEQGRNVLRALNRIKDLLTENKLQIVALALFD